jgi:hypothetical protein
VGRPFCVLADEDQVEAVARHAEQRGFRPGCDVIDYLRRRHARDLLSGWRFLPFLGGAQHEISH